MRRLLRDLLLFLGAKLTAWGNSIGPIIPAAERERFVALSTRTVGHVRMTEAEYRQLESTRSEVARDYFKGEPK